MQMIPPVSFLRLEQSKGICIHWSTLLAFLIYPSARTGQLGIYVFVIKFKVTFHTN